MKLTGKDIKRIDSVMMLHQASLDRAAGNELFTCTVLDEKKIPIGTVQSDSNGKSYYKEIGK